MGLASRLRILPTASQPLTIPVSVSASGDNVLIGGASVYRMRVLSYLLVAAGVVSVQWKSGIGGNALSGAMPMIANQPLVAGQPALEAWVFQTDVGQPLVLNLSAGVAVTGHVTYTLETE